MLGLVPLVPQAALVPQVLPRPVVPGRVPLLSLSEVLYPADLFGQVPQVPHSLVALTGLQVPLPRPVALGVLSLGLQILWRGVVLIGSLYRLRLIGPCQNSGIPLASRRSRWP